MYIFPTVSGWIYGLGFFVCLFFGTGLICVALASLKLTDILLPLLPSRFCFKIFTPPSESNCNSRLDSVQMAAIRVGFNVSLPQIKMIQVGSLSCRAALIALIDEGRLRRSKGRGQSR